MLERLACRFVLLSEPSLAQLNLDHQPSSWLSLHFVASLTYIAMNKDYNR